MNRKTLRPILLIALALLLGGLLITRWPPSSVAVGSVPSALTIAGGCIQITGPAQLEAINPADQHDPAVQTALAAANVTETTTICGKTAPPANAPPPHGGSGSAPLGGTAPAVPSRGVGNWP